MPSYYQCFSIYGEILPSLGLITGEHWNIFLFAFLPLINVLFPKTGHVNIVNNCIFFLCTAFVGILGNSRFLY